MVDPESDESLGALADAWLADASGLRSRSLPPALRRAFERHTRRVRSRTSGLIGLLGACVAVALYPTLADAVPELQGGVQSLYLGLALPCIVAASLPVLLDLRPALRECLLAIPSLVTPAVLTTLFIWSQTAHPHVARTNLYVMGMIVLMLFSTVTIQLRFLAAAVVACFSFALFLIAMAVAPSLDATYQRGLGLMGAICMGYMLLANWRINLQQEHTYVLTLRERLRREKLAQENRALHALARHDALTGLANRRAFDAWLHTTCLRARDTGMHVGLIMLDVDHFKKFNDFYGHPAGDRCLIRLADCLREQLRGTSDQIARIGGEEFTIILPGATLPTCVAMAERLREAVTRLQMAHLGHGGGEIVTISCGCASLQATPLIAPLDLCAAADAALYRAKEGGRDRVCASDALIPLGEERGARTAAPGTS